MACDSRLKKDAADVNGARASLPAKRAQHAQIVDEWLACFTSDSERADARLRARMPALRLGQQFEICIFQFSIFNAPISDLGRLRLEHKRQRLIN